MNADLNLSLGGLIFMRYGIPISESRRIIDDWLKAHPQQSPETLASLFSSDRIIVKNKKLFEIPTLSLKEAIVLAAKIQQDDSLEIKDRWYHLKLYRNCFIGSELVDYFQKHKNLTVEEAIALGQGLFRHNLIRHVCEDHHFKDGFFFYRFV